jgi:enoyl-CoA hydratase/carnithine racemase
MSRQHGDVSITIDEHYVATVELHRPPNSFFDVGLIRSLADGYESLDDDPACRAVLLCSEGQHFCAAHALAVEVAKSAPLAVRSIRRTLRGDLGARVRTATERENAEQERLRFTSDWAEGVQASAQRREPLFQGK